jgi:hypothetical protein
MSDESDHWWEVEDPRDVLDDRYDDHHELVVAVVDYEAEYGFDAVEELDITEYRPSSTPGAPPEYLSVPAAHLL